MAAIGAHGTARPSAPTTRRSVRLGLDGARDITPMVIGIVPFALAIGAASVGTSTGIVSAPVILAGAAQLAALEMLGNGTTPAVVVLSALLINARILLYSASLAPWFADRPLRTRLLLAMPVIDQLQLTCVPRFEQGDLDAGERISYYLGAATWLVSAWVGAQAAAYGLGARLPEAAHLEMAAPLALVGLLAKTIAGRSSSIAAALAVATVFVVPGLPWHSTVLVASLVGIGAAVVTRREEPRDV